MKRFWAIRSILFRHICRYFGSRLRCRGIHILVIPGRGGLLFGSGGWGEGAVFAGQQSPGFRRHPGAAGIEDVVDKEEIGDAVASAIIDDVVGEVAEIKHMHLLERTEKVARNRIAVAVFKDGKLAAVPDPGLHLHYQEVAPHEGEVSVAAPILEFLEELALEGLPLTNHPEIFVKIYDRECRGIGFVFGGVVDEILRGILDRDVLGVAIHRADEAVDDILIEL